MDNVFSGNRFSRVKCLLGLVGLRKLLILALCLSSFLLCLSYTAQGAGPDQIRVVMDDAYPPYAFRDEKGNLVGILPEWWRLWEKETGISVKLMGTNWHSAQEMILRGGAEVIDTIFKTPEREKIFLFSRPYAKIPAAVFHSREVSGIVDIEALKKIPVGVKAGDADAAYLRSRGLTDLVYFPDYASIIKAAVKGDIQVFCMDEPPALYYLYRERAVQRFRKALVLFTGAFHRAVLRSNPDVFRIVEDGFERIPEAKLKAVEQKWLGEPVEKSEVLKYLMWTCSGLVLLILVILAWSISLNRAVARKTEEYLLLMKELEEEKETLSVTLYSIGEGVITTDATGKITRMNTMAEKLTGWTEEDAVGRSFEEVFHVLNEETRTPVCNPVKRVLEEGAIVGLGNHTLLISRDGTERPIADSAAPIRDSQGNVLGVVVIFRDQTEERAYRTRLERMNSELNLALEAAGCSIVRLHVPTGTVLRDSRWCEMLGFTSEEISPDVSFWLGLIHDGDRDRVRRAFEDHILGKTPFFEREYRMRHKKGKWVWVYERGSVVDEDPDGNPLWYTGIVMDITERKETEKRLLDLEAQLQQAAKLEAIGRLAGGIAHDLNNTLQVIIGFGDLGLREASPDTRVREYLLKIKRAAQGSARIVKQVLTFARRDIIRPEVIHLGAYLEETVPMYRRLVGENIDFRVSIEEDVWPLWMDPVQLDQMLMNLIVNAKDAIEGHGIITLSVSNVTVGSEREKNGVRIRPGDYVLISVSDTGCGIDPEIKDLIFEPFFTTKEAGKGTGLGLSTVYGIVKRNGGWITVESTPGRGTRFDILIPRYTGDLSKEHVDASPKSPIAQPGRKNLLLVEDDEMILSYAWKVLTMNGYRVVSFSSPKDVLSWVSREVAEGRADVDLLITDVVLPQMSGVDLWKRLKDYFPGLRCIFVSGYPAEELRRFDLPGEGISFLEKPFSSRDLLDRVALMLAGVEG
ncbi:PAS domain-containing protein [Thermodesulforhabdus norvegica]|uniref:histidine kinase n=1 Tax=Thermodesulforhabdus norvegica TaxID=39841 RepID=A0A1I4TSE4_9BACT|nr:PAS domain-containing protein [Thermodesulforhabdus norvegica]SFM79497.1 PAS domain S-box-containing protein [Thermodesulforhabdus norvegica]